MFDSRMRKRNVGPVRKKIFKSLSIFYFFTGHSVQYCLLTFVYMFLLTFVYIYMCICIYISNMYMFKNVSKNNVSYICIHRYTQIIQFCTFIIFNT